MKSLLGLLFLLFASGCLSAQAAPDDPDQLFQGAGVTEAPSSGADTVAAQKSLLKTKDVTLGGRLYSDLTSLAVWPEAYPKAGDPAGSVSQLIPNLQSDLWFDARPETDFRVFGKFKLASPFTPTTPAASAIPAAYAPSPVSPTGANVSVFELYTDINWDQKLFLRAGQQVAHWGVGYFFSPADVLSRQRINPLDPQRERQGPLAVKASVPFGGVNTAQLYLLTDPSLAENCVLRPDDVAVAPKVEFVTGDWEWGVGGYLQKNQGSKALVTASGSIAGKLGVYGEAVVQKRTGTGTSDLLSTVGLNYIDSGDHVALNAQYYFNGPGSDSLTAERGALAALPASASDQNQMGRHYLGASAAWTDIRASNIDLGVFYEGNLSDGSGVIGPSAAYSPFTRFTVSLTPYFAYGEKDSEFVRSFGYTALALKVSIGTGDF